MTSRWIWLSSQIIHRIWFRASLFSLLAIATALVAIFVRPYIPSNWTTSIGADAVDNVLSIIASSMLTVTTFSLSTMVSAYSAATSSVTPRATRLIMQDSTTQNVLATFVGSFLFSLVGIIALSTGAYGESGRVVLFVVTIAVIVLIIVTLLRWIDHLSSLGRVTETTARVEVVTIEAMRSRRERPFLGCRPLNDASFGVPATARPIFPSAIGYVQHLDTGGLSAIATAGGGQIFVRTIPGQLTGTNEPVAWSVGLRDHDLDQDAIRSCFSIGQTRSFDQDPRFGACVLAEIASRALSPAVNDPGTAIDVITRAIRVLSVWAEPVDPALEAEILYPNVHVPPIDLAGLFDDLFVPIARDGAGIIEVGLQLQKALRVLSLYDDDRFRQNARRHSVEALGRAELQLAFAGDRERIRRASEAVRRT